MVFFSVPINRLDILHAVEVWQRNFKRIVSNPEEHFMFSGLDLCIKIPSESCSVNLSHIESLRMK